MLKSGVPFPAVDRAQTTYYGISYDNAKKMRQERLSPALFLYYKSPVMLNQGHMQWIWDHTGKRYLDMYAGIVTVSVGHCHPKVNQAAREQMDKLWHTTNIYMHPRIHEYAEKLTERLPGNLKVCFFCNSGSEANDLAMLMAKLYTGATDIISLRNAYHGINGCTVGLCGVGSWKFMVPGISGIHHTMNPDPYKGLWGGSHCRDSPVQTQRQCSCETNQCQATNQYIEQLQEIFKYSLPKKRIAAFFAESIQGVGGTVQFTKGYLKKAFEMVRERGGLCVSDEVQTGFVRTGSHYWGFQNHDVVPDIVTMAKGIGNGYPLAAVVTTPEISKTLSEATFFNTFGGNPVACAVGSTVLDIIDEEKHMENCNRIGKHLLDQLAKLRDEFEIVGDVRGKGLMIGVELVTSKESKNPLPVSDMNDIFEDCKEMGLIIGKGGESGNVFRIKPPMCITQADADFCVAVMRKAFSNYVQRTNN
ncbi:alanine--glyoxylate aminotransferase 2, mitochondrial-like isoform X1 [Limulus polyphemus]|uniref:Alanine--glyoxylate aminotransferase 2, mitochondrial n=2 Tax=Limulus polyphemus TaxID=6850 RepID=A0ABM1SSA5_LIMPO|nr:alanine--glyoxylate aminotransferase 2, mitochondrial-like isoform X1 [Limulus polyphemus]